MLAKDPEPSKYITLVSNDGFEFVVLREAACVSSTISRMLSTANGGGFQEAMTGICRFEELRYVYTR
jgi:transcription elongation factor B subunit 1